MSPVTCNESLTSSTEPVYPRYEGDTVVRWEDAMQVDCLIEVIEAARKSWEYVLGLVPADSMERPDPHGGWTVKDHIAHIAWHEDQMVQLIEAKALVGSPWWELPTDERNEHIHEQYKDKSFQEIQSIAEDSYLRMMAALATLEDADLNESKRFENMPEDWIPWTLIAGNTYEHYLEHQIGIRRMLRNPKWEA